MTNTWNLIDVTL
jgi:hypothetical protein